MNARQVTCDCGELLSCWGFTTTCPYCGRNFNSFGQRLTPRSQWDGYDDMTREDKESTRLRLAEAINMLIDQGYTHWRRKNSGAHGQKIGSGALTYLLTKWANDLVTVEYAEDSDGACVYFVNRWRRLPLYFAKLGGE